MDSLFGDATTAMGTPSVRSETGSIYGGRATSPVPSFDLRGRAGPELAIPPMDIDPPHVNMIDGKPQIPQARSESQSRGRVGDWLNRMTGRGTSGSRGPAYERLDQRDD